jgi:hypothetical protein
MSLTGPMLSKPYPLRPYPTAGMPFPGGPMNTPASNPAAMSPMGLVAQLGSQTQVRLDGSIQYNEPLVQAIVQCRERALPQLKSLFESTIRIPTMLEGLYAAEKLADAHVADINLLYPALQRWNSHPDPTIQMHLARLYRKMGEPRTFGPMLATLVNGAMTQYSMQSSPTYNVSEEAGATVLNQIAQRTADETVQRLLPYLQAPRDLKKQH